MKYLLAILLAFALAACQRSESDTLRDENQRLKTELETVTKERDAFKQQLEGIRAVLENSGAVTTIPAPDSSTPQAAPTPPAAPDSGSSSVPPSAPVEPPPSSGALPAPSATPDAPSSDAAQKLRAYAESVLSAAQNFQAQTKQAPPTDCSSGYAAGDYEVEDAQNIAETCTVTIKGDGSYAVQASDSSGNTVTAP
jgi:hypothetical protein